MSIHYPEKLFCDVNSLIARAVITPPIAEVLPPQSPEDDSDAAQGLVTEAQKTMKEAEVEALRDCLIGSAATKVEHYEIASYRGLIMGAQVMGQQEVVTLLQQNLEQEEQTAQRLEQSAPQLLRQALQAEGTQEKGLTQESRQTRQTPR